MIDRQHIEHILRVNGIKPTAPEEEIRSVLISAKWEDEEVETALTVLRENPNTKESRVDTLRNVFHSDARLSPEAIEALLGIEVEMSSDELRLRRARRDQVSFLQVMTIIFYATVLAFGSVLVVMYTQKFGPFHPGG
jgi:hypothetical protein